MRFFTWGFAAHIFAGLLVLALAILEFALAVFRWRPNPFVGHVPWHRMRHA